MKGVHFEAVVEQADQARHEEDEAHDFFVLEQDLVGLPLHHLKVHHVGELGGGVES